MANITIKAGLNSAGFRSGLKQMEAEANNFRAAFRKNIENGGGLFGSIDAALGKLASGRFAAPLAIMGAAVSAINGQVQRLNAQWENFGRATNRAQQNLEAIKSLHEQIAGQRFAGDRASTEAERAARAANTEMYDKTATAAAMKDPTTISGAFSNEIKRSGREGAGWRTLDALALLTGASFVRSGLSKIGLAEESKNPLFLGATTVIGSAGVPIASNYFDAQNELFNEQKSAADRARTEAIRRGEMLPFEQFAYRTAQRAGDSAQMAAEDRLGMAQGRTMGFEAAAKALILANQQYEDARRTIKNDNDPRVQQARGAALDAFTAYDSEITQARRFRNDPTIAADSLARLGGGGGVNVFGDGRGELLFEQKRLNTSISGLTRVMQTLNVTLSRTNLGGDVD